MATRIEWTDWTVNPFPGCRKVSPGCANCYAERMAKRLKGKGVPAYRDVVDENGWTGKIGYNTRGVTVPGKHKMVFCQSMGDLFYERVSAACIELTVCEMRDQPQHIFQVLTKRIERVAGFVKGLTKPFPDNLWLGVTCENPDYRWRISVLRTIPAQVRFISFEPLLEPIPDVELRGIDWCIIGAESGPGRRRCENRWITGLIVQADEANVPVFVKQIDVKGEIVKDIDRISGILDCPPESLRQWPKAQSKK